MEFEATPSPAAVEEPAVVDWASVTAAAAQWAASQQQSPPTKGNQQPNSTLNAALASLTLNNELLKSIEGREKPCPGGKAWAKVYQGPDHVFFGHDAKRWVLTQALLSNFIALRRIPKNLH